MEEEREGEGCIGLCHCRDHRDRAAFVVRSYPKRESILATIPGKTMECLLQNVINEELKMVNINKLVSVWFSEQMLEMGKDSSKHSIPQIHLLLSELTSFYWKLYRL